MKYALQSILGHFEIVESWTIFQKMTSLWGIWRHHVMSHDTWNRNMRLTSTVSVISRSTKALCNFNFSRLFLENDIFENADFWWIFSFMTSVDNRWRQREFSADIKIIQTESGSMCSTSYFRLVRTKWKTNPFKGLYTLQNK